MSPRHVGVPDQFKSFIDRRVNSKTVLCPTCGADVEENCRRPDGEPYLSNTGCVIAHPRRRRMAVRRLNNLQEEK